MSCARVAKNQNANKHAFTPAQENVMKRCISDLWQKKMHMNDKIKIKRIWMQRTNVKMFVNFLSELCERYDLPEQKREFDHHFEYMLNSNVKTKRKILFEKNKTEASSEFSFRLFRENVTKKIMQIKSICVNMQQSI